MRSFEVGGRFGSDFESDQISEGITAERTNVTGTTAQWWKFDSANSVKDDIYDVEPIGAGRVWTGPKTLSVVTAHLSEGSSGLNERGFYNVDTLHMVLNIDDVYTVAPEIFSARGVVSPTIDLVNKYRIVFKGQVYRPIKTQPSGLVADRYTLIVIDLTQLAPDELVNDAQFLTYAQP
ncbi:hypothetical protein UFOVP115_12 [uncultured Caudovirales phage]|uniref:Uncharacterized protein n=1 Tax=uncultured Caudovirales phage TaxID=2100421 RepID=A0A6J5L7D8_9CAUD|nr:hypothetical protein UFOVP115_12 [uncultured Caudovirales phage]